MALFNKNPEIFFRVKLQLPLRYSLVILSVGAPGVVAHFCNQSDIWRLLSLEVIINKFDTRLWRELNLTGFISLVNAISPKNQPAGCVKNFVYFGHIRFWV